MMLVIYLFRLNSFIHLELKEDALSWNLSKFTRTAGVTTRYGKGRYDQGQRRCSVCEIFISTVQTSNICPCCKSKGTYYIVWQEYLATTRIGRYHNVHSNNINDDKPNLQSYFRSLYNDNSKKQPLDLSKPPFGHKRTPLQKVLANANKAMEKSNKFINKIKSRQLACVKRAKSIPGNAMIRQEYIKCGKQTCEIEDGPYYYAY